jgi:hypothetical protein
MDKRHTEEEKNIVNMFNEYKEFIKDKHVAFVIKKTERIVYGVYMLSRFVPLEDTLHQDLKKTSSSLLALTSSFVSTTGIGTKNIDKVHADLQYMSSLLSLAFISGYISSSNIEIMKNEINYLHKHIEELSTRSASESGQLHIKSDMFVVQHTKHVKQAEEKMSFTKESKPLVPTPKTSAVSFKKSPVQAVPVGARIEEPKDNREKRILDVIRDKGIVSIKDISTVIFDVSEKTIQRTLQLLIDKGQIKKEGERRWAKYQLI